VTYTSTTVGAPAASSVPKTELIFIPFDARKVSEYEQQAAECRERAAQMKDLTYKKEFEDLIDTVHKMTIL
jgi:hypothetical protein